MQGKSLAEEVLPLNSTAQYRILVVCNKCGGLHEIGIAVTIQDGPTEKRSLGEFYEQKSLPKSLADLTNTGISCPKTGRQSIQKNLHQIFLVPNRSESLKPRR
jgi:hypothetical protein